MSGILPEWMQRVLGIETGPGEGTVWSLDHAWTWAPWLTVLLVAAIAIYVLTFYLREGREATVRQKVALAVIRLAVVAILLSMIAQLTISLERTGLPYVAVLVDNSQSMARVDRYDNKQRSAMESRVTRAGYHGLSRFDLARTLLSEDDGELIGDLSDRYKLRMYYLAESGGARPSQAEGKQDMLRELHAAQSNVPATPLGTAVQSILSDLRGAPPAAIVLLSDGINTEGSSLVEGSLQARRRGVPLFAVGLGDERPIRDLKLTDLLVDDVVFVGDVVNFEFKLTGTGLEGRQVEVQLHEKGKSDVLARLTATVGPDGRADTLRIPYRPDRVGRFQYVVEVKPPDGPSESSASRQERVVEVRKEKIRVLLVQAYPSFEFRYLRNMLSRDESIDLHTFLQEADVDHAEQDPAALRVFPVRRDELFAYDVVILGDVNPALLGESALDNLADFVNQKAKGGALVLIAGPKYMPLALRATPLAPLLPIDLTSARYPDPEQLLGPGFSAQPTDLGLDSPPLQLGDTAAQTRSIWRALPPLYWMLEAPDLKPAARVLAEHPTRLGRAARRLPLIVMQYVGAGRVLMHMTDETWRWRQRVGDVYFARYWVQTIRYLARSKLTADRSTVEFTTDHREYQHGEPVRLRTRFVDERLAPAEEDGVTVVLEHQGHKTQRVKLRRSATSRGSFDSVVDQPAPGVYHAWIAIPALEGRAPAADFTVVPPPGEMETVPMDVAELQRAAELTKGRFYTFATAGRLLEDLPAGRQVPVESLPPKPLWSTWPVVLTLLILLTLEWLLRKRRGMV